MSKAVFIDYKKTDLPKDYLARILKLFGNCKFIPRDNPKLVIELNNAEVIFCKISTKVGKDIIDATPKLKYIGVQSTAFDAIDAKYARKKGVDVCNLGGYSTEAVAEFVFASLFEKARELEEAKNRAKKEDYGIGSYLGLELKDKTLGVVGAGKIGSRIAEIGLGIGMNVDYFSRKKKPKIEKLGAKKKSIDKVLTNSDFVALALLFNKQTEGVINKKRINMLKKGCVFINIAPPHLIDQNTMMKKADKGDVVFIFDHSDDIPKSLAKKFLKTKNVVVYPPVAFRTEEANVARFETFTSNIESFLKGKPQNVVN